MFDRRYVGRETVHGREIVSNIKANGYETYYDFSGIP